MARSRSFATQQATGLNKLMPKKKRDEQPANLQAPELPPGVKLLRALEGHKDIVNGVAFDPAGKVLASGSNDQTIRLWDITNGQLLRTLEGHEKNVLSVAFDPTGRLLATGSDDQTVKLWDATSGNLLHTFADY